MKLNNEASSFDDGEKAKGKKMKDEFFCESHVMQFHERKRVMCLVWRLDVK